MGGRRRTGGFTHHSTMAGRHSLPDSAARLRDRIRARRLRRRPAAAPAAPARLRGLLVHRTQYSCTQSAVRRSFQQLRGSRIYSVNVVNFQWIVFISDFMHMRDKTVHVCGFWSESLPLLKAGVDCCV